MKIETVSDFRAAIEASARTYLSGITAESVQGAVNAQLDDMRDSIALAAIGARRDSHNNQVVIESNSPLNRAIHATVTDAVTKWMAEHGAALFAEIMAEKSVQTMMTKGFKASVKDALFHAVSDYGAQAARELAQAWAEQTATKPEATYSVDDAVSEFEFALRCKE